jgi:hypothetical protein
MLLVRTLNNSDSSCSTLLRMSSIAAADSSDAAVSAMAARVACSTTALAEGVGPRSKRSDAAAAATAAMHRDSTFTRVTRDLDSTPMLVPLVAVGDHSQALVGSTVPSGPSPMLEGCPPPPSNSPTWGGTAGYSEEALADVACTWRV